MTKFNATITTLAALLLSGAAFAQMPAAGEAPLPANAAGTPSNTTRAVVRAEAAKQSKENLKPHRHEMDSMTLSPRHAQAAQSRAEVRQQTRDAIARGERVKSGEQN